MQVLSFQMENYQGRSLFLIDGKNADAYLLANKSGELFLVEASAPGIEVIELTTVDKTRTSIELILKEC